MCHPETDSPPPSRRSSHAATPSPTDPEAFRSYAPLAPSLADFEPESTPPPVLAWLGQTAFPAGNHRVNPRPSVRRRADKYCADPRTDRVASRAAAHSVETSPTTMPTIRSRRIAMSPCPWHRRSSPSAPPSPVAPRTSRDENRPSAPNRPDARAASDDDDADAAFAVAPTSPPAIATAVALSPRPSRRLPSPGIPSPTSARNRHTAGDTTPATVVSPPPANADWGPGHADDAPGRRRLHSDTETMPASSGDNSVPAVRSPQPVSSPPT